MSCYNTDYDYLKEMKKLAEGLVIRGIPFEFHKLYEGFQIQVFDSDSCDNQIWDAVCHSGSYGHVHGLLEIAGVIVKGDDVEGYLTAEEILRRV